MTKPFVFKVWVPNHGDTVEDAVEVSFVIGSKAIPNWRCYAAEETARVMYNENDGWEWMRDKPFTLRVQDPDGMTEIDFAVELEFEPRFYAHQE